MGEWKASQKLNETKAFMPEYEFWRISPTQYVDRSTIHIQSQQWQFPSQQGFPT